MIGIVARHPDEIFLQKLGSWKELDDFEDSSIKSIFIDWVPKVPVHEDDWMRQASLLQAYIKTGIPIVIFDRHFSLTEKEVKWVKKFNTYLFEPALNSGRIGFSYLPEWITNLEISIDDEDREYDVVWSHHQLEYQLKGFERWIKDYARLFPDKKVAYSTFNISEFKEEEFKKDNLIFLDHRHPIHNEGFFTVAFDSKKSYEIGHLNPIYFNAMVLGCLPLLPVEHKYFHSMFKGLVIKDVKEMDYYVSLFKKVTDVTIEEILDRIKNEWNEFTVDHAADVVKACYEQH